MKNIVRIVTSLLVLLLPLSLVIPKIPISSSLLIPLIIGIIAFFLITALMAREGYKKWMILLLVVVVAVVGISYIPITVSPKQLLGYYIPVIVALLLSAVSHLLGWLRKGQPNEDKSRPKNRDSTKGWDEDE